MRFPQKIVGQELCIYLVVGGLTALIYFGFFALSVNIFDLDYRLGITIAYIFAVIFHFLTNRKFTFRSAESPVIHQWLRYLGVLLVNYLITLGVVSFFVDRLGFSTYVSAGLSLLATVGVGYFASKFWVFRNKESLRD